MKTKSGIPLNPTMMAGTKGAGGDFFISGGEGDGDIQSIGGELQMMDGSIVVTDGHGNIKKRG